MPVKRRWRLYLEYQKQQLVQPHFENWFQCSAHLTADPVTADPGIAGPVTADPVTADLVTAAPEVLVAEFVRICAADNWFCVERERKRKKKEKWVVTCKTK